jgi:hypothetical protein
MQAIVKPFLGKNPHLVVYPLTTLGYKKRQTPAGVYLN